MTEKQPHQPQNQPTQPTDGGAGPDRHTPPQGALPTYGSTPYDGTQPLPQSSGRSGPEQQYGGPGAGDQYGRPGAHQGTHPVNPSPWPGQPGRVSYPTGPASQPGGTGLSGGTGGPAPHQSGPQGAGPQGAGPQGTGPRGSGRKRRGLALVATTALLVGTAGGVGGAAVYSALDDDPVGSGSVTAPLTAGGAAPAAATDGSVQKAAESVLPSVVKIAVQTQRGAGSGSGIVISADGLIVTNNHVVEAAANGGQITVTLNDGRTVAAQVVGTDPLTDLAVLRADAKGLTPAKLGASGALAVGQPVVAIGSPFGLEATVTSGIVSALNRPVTSGGGGGDSTTVFPAVQTDAAINPGNSGGALIDLAGRVVGINSAIKSGGGQSEGGSIGLGFAIPIDQAKPIIDELVANKTATHARLGVSVGNAASSNGLQSGAKIAEVTPGGAADKAGLAADDVVTAIDGKVIASGDALVATVRSHRPGDEVKVTVRRGSETKTMTAKLVSDGGNPTG